MDASAVVVKLFGAERVRPLEGEYVWQRTGLTGCGEEGAPLMPLEVRYMRLLVTASQMGFKETGRRCHGNFTDVTVTSYVHKKLGALYATVAVDKEKTTYTVQYKPTIKTKQCPYCHGTGRR